MLDEATLRELAATQHGVASRVQLQQAGLTPRAIRHRIGTGRWVSIGRNVVALGPVPTDIWGRAQAGVLAVPSATVSHRTAGALHGLPGLSPA
ncbi:MAG: type IV toxin-antitoxin system AbiEi family antitoxin domain-containing protein, partial [Candidatus Microthrix subdominans]